MRRRLRVELSFRPSEVVRLGARVAGNNRLLHLRSEDGRELIAKLYYRDGRQRLEREFGALEFLRRRGLTSLPVPHLRDDELYCAVYSFELGATKRASELTRGDVVAMARFAADLHRVRPGEAGASFPPAIASSFSLAESVETIRARLRTFRAFAATRSAYPPVRALDAEFDVAALFERLIASAVAGLTPAALEVRLPESEWRLNTADFAPHNILVRPDGGICVLDLEYFGWDDPTALPVGFVAADTSRDLAPESAELFLRTYREGSDLPTSIFARFALVRTLMEIHWGAVHLTGMTEDKVENKRFGTPDFDLDRYLADQAAKFRIRLVRAEASTAALAG